MTLFLNSWNTAFSRSFENLAFTPLNLVGKCSDEILHADNSAWDYCSSWVCSLALRPAGKVSSYPYFFDSHNLQNCVCISKIIGNDSVTMITHKCIMSQDCWKTLYFSDLALKQKQEFAKAKPKYFSLYFQVLHCDHIF